MVVINLNIQPPQVSREQWIKQIEEIEEQIDEMDKIESDKWDRLLYFSRALWCGQEARKIMDTGFKWFSNTKITETFTEEQIETIFMVSRSVLISLIDIFRNLMKLHLEIEPEDKEKKEDSSLAI